MQRTILLWTLLSSLAALAPGAAPAAVARRPTEALQATVDLRPCTVNASDGEPEEVLCGSYEVWEDREARAGRRISLNIVKIPARATRPQPDPIVFLAGGPGVGATASAVGFVQSSLREQRDILLVDQRGTGRSNPLSCSIGGDNDPQAYLDPLGDVEAFRRCLDELRGRADPALYTTPIAMDDLDEVRLAMGYERLNLIATSYGTRAALVYIRRHGEHVRAASLSAIFPLGLRTPLYTARDSQLALDAHLADCAADPDCRATFPSPQEDLEAVLARFDTGPVDVTMPRPQGDPIRIALDRNGFTTALRIALYTPPTARAIPFLLQRARQGDLAYFAGTTIGSNRGLVDQIALGLLFTVYCSENVSRIQESEIAGLHENTFLGDRSLRNVQAVCAFWPAGSLPDNYFEPVRSNVATLLFSSTYDPITPPEWAEQVARSFSNARHVRFAGGHGFNGLAAPCLGELQASFFEAGSPEGLDASCLESIEQPPFRLGPDQASSE